MVRSRSVLIGVAVVAAALSSSAGRDLRAQTYSNNPYRPVPWPKPWMPDGQNGAMDFGPTTAIFADPATDHIWIATRCGRTPLYHSSNEGCTWKPGYDMVFKFDLDGNLVARFGAGTMAAPHSMYVDKLGNVWIADQGGVEYGHTAAETAAEQARLKIGHQVVKFSPTGQILMRIGAPGQPGSDERHLANPSSVAVAPDGSIFVGDSHGGSRNRRIVKYAADGTFIKQIGCSDCGADVIGNTQWGRFNDPHVLTFDSQGRLFVGDKGNFRVQIFDQELKLLDVWTQFGARPGSRSIRRPT
jgi:hypothetical protein